MKIILAFILSSITLCTFSQGVRIAPSGTPTASPAAQLDVNASNIAAPLPSDIMLTPRVDAFPTNNPTEDGILLYLKQTVGANTKGFYYWDNTTGTWTRILDRNKSTAMPSVKVYTKVRVYISDINGSGLTIVDSIVPNNQLFANNGALGSNKDDFMFDLNFEPYLPDRPKDANYLVQVTLGSLYTDYQKDYNSSVNSIDKDNDYLVNSGNYTIDKFTVSLSTRSTYNTVNKLYVDVLVYTIQ